MFGLGTDPRDVGFLQKYVISTDGHSFEIILTSNFLISSYEFSTDDKTLRFNIETGLAEENVAEIIIPRDLIDGEFTVLLNDKEISANVNETNRSSVISIEFSGQGKHTLDISATKYLGVELEKSKGGGCLIATAAFGSEIAPQVQQLRELRDNTILQTQSGTNFVAGFNQFYYLFSPAVADYERENPIFKEAVKLALIPLLTSLALLQYVDIDSESEMLGYGISLILVNIGIYFVAPAILIINIRKRVNIEKLDKKYV